MAPEIIVVDCGDYPTKKAVSQLKRGNRNFRSVNPIDVLNVVSECEPCIVILSIVGDDSEHAQIKLVSHIVASARHEVICICDSGRDSLQASLFEAGSNDVLENPVRDAKLWLALARSNRVLALTRQIVGDTKIIERKIAELELLNRKFLEISYIEECSGLFNRRYGRQRISEILESNRRGGVATWIFFFDLDGLKRINDAWGHAAGEKAICSFGEFLWQVFPRNDVFCWGADEFVAICSILTQAAATALATRVIENCRRIDVFVDTAILRLSVSAGVACARADESIDSVISRADDALRIAKAAGGNGVIVSVSDGRGDD